MGRIHLYGAVVCACVLTGCGGGPRSPVGPVTSSPVVRLVVPAIHGRVREANGGPLSGVSIRQRWNMPEVRSDQDGAFDFVAQPCGGPASVFVVGDSLHWFPSVPMPACTSDATNPEVTLEIKGQPRLSLTQETPLQTTLSNDDVSWVQDSNGYSCGPCKLVLLEQHLSFPLEVRVDWDSGEPLHVWLEGDDNYDTVKLAERVAAPGEHSITIGISDDWSHFVPFGLKVGIPIGGLGLSGVVTVRISARAVAR